MLILIDVAAGAYLAVLGGTISIALLYQAHKAGTLLFWLLVLLFVGSVVWLCHRYAPQRAVATYSTTVRPYISRSVVARDPQRRLVE